MNGYDIKSVVEEAKRWLASDDPSDAIEAADLFARALVDLAEPVLMVHVDENDPEVREAIEKLQDDLANASMHAFLHAPTRPWNDEPIWPVRRAFEQVCAENPERIKELNRQWDEMSAEERDAFAAAVIGPWLTEKEPNEA